MWQAHYDAAQGAAVSIRRRARARAHLVVPRGGATTARLFAGRGGQKFEHGGEVGGGRRDGTATAAAAGWPVRERELHRAALPSSSSECSGSFAVW